ncbi:restriction endonuclease subunit S [Vibrio splendidus]|uniref:restriction endonuclease subunit S n=1 Tax=Vibrio splendidus TaxID=29497 RepID=UPI002468C537|nr:restriction endonuclease subunit S [Vibrio splendidus]MDH5914440.1 restriction endonuclease subunit S [Vibrio splendidus]MDH5943510.1 restriction endonuclease subunit S [Vibrio splendidus]MDH5985156.1 restriction endonuclease subunit S [Vibrio splendidus]MDH5995259.1 restriction endonuclease subunit S [Vibrio splendidus]MDH6006749.1 restriction endonuclease subunit S [Vibrio splendidus]
MTMDTHPLPSNWSKAKIKDIGLTLTGNTPSKSNPKYYGGVIPYIKPPSLQDCNISHSEETLSEEGLAVARFLPKNSTLVSCIGNLGKTGFLKNAAAFNQQINGIAPYHGVNPKFIFFQCQSLFVRRQLEDKATATTISIVNKGNFDEVWLNIPPFNEQSRIVEKIEELFSELDKGIESLKKAKQQLAVYRQALLKQSFEGKLTEQWRKDNADKLPSSEEQLAAIQKEREDRFQQQIEEWEIDVKTWENNGEEGKKPTKPKLLKINSFNVTESNKSDYWHTTSLLNMLLSKPANGKSVRDLIGGFPVLRLTSLKKKYVDLDEAKEGLWTKKEAKPYIIRHGDFLLSRGNGSKRLVGRGALVNDSTQEVAYPDTIVRLSLSKVGLEPELFSYFWNSAVFRTQIENSARTTAGIYKINQAVISDYHYPVISLEEQKLILELLDQKLSISQQTENDIEENLKKAEILRQSILKKAFSGKLVTQDLNDEKVSELLKKIAIEKEEVTRKEKADKAAARKKKAAANKTSKS